MHRLGSFPGRCSRFRQRPFDRIIEVALAANLRLDLDVAASSAAIVTYAAEPTEPALPVRELMTRNLLLHFMLLYTVPAPALR